MRIPGLVIATIVVVSVNSANAEFVSLGIVGPVALSTAELRRPAFGAPALVDSPLPSDYFDPVPPESQLMKSRLVAWGVLTAGASYLAYEQSQASWGVSNGHFHFKDDLRDGLALSDETSHLFAAYHLTRALNTGYHWTGLSPTASRRLAAAHAWVWTFLIEYPVDALNPTQGFGVSDLAFNTVGVMSAYQHTRPGTRPRWGIKISVKGSFFDGESRFIAHSDEQYDDYVYWLTVRPMRHRYVPLWLGAGYSTTHQVWPKLDRELHLAVGTTLEDIVAMFSEDAARYLRPFDFFFLNLGTKIVIE